MRVISGFLKGKKLQGYNLKGTRPTMDKIKEAVFAIIQNSVRDSICLDLFAGSGSLGIEAISNGALKVYFVDNNKEAIVNIKDNINKFNIEDKAIIIFDDYQRILNKLKDDNIKFNLIFLDPPYKEKILATTLCFIAENDLLLRDGQVICEYKEEELCDSYGSLKMQKDKQYGGKQIKIYKLLSK